MKKLLASVVVLVGTLGSSAASAQTWTYRVNPANDYQTVCINADGRPVGPWRHCSADGTCNNGIAIQNKCAVRHGEKAQAKEGKEVSGYKSALIVSCGDHLFNILVDEAANKIACAMGGQQMPPTVCSASPGRIHFKMTVADYGIAGIMNVDLETMRWEQRRFLKETTDRGTKFQKLEVTGGRCTKMGQDRRPDSLK